MSLREIAKAAADRVLVPLLCYLYAEVVGSVRRYTVIDEVNARLSSQCAEYVITNMGRALQFSRREFLWDHAIANRSANGIIAEFGVADGDSINYFAKALTPLIVHGFDSFEGLHEDWAGGRLPKGWFDRRGKVPKVRSNVRLVKGWFHESLPAFMSQNQQPFSLIHIDCDTYEATNVVFGQTKDALAVGTILIFDEYFGFRGWQIGEFKAWQELVKTQSISYEYLGFSDFQVSVRITAIGN